jgi:hypothetical protein
MRWTVIWTEAALRDLTRLWTDADDRQAVKDSSDRIEDALKVDAQVKGIDFGTARINSDDPLAALYELDHGDCKVNIVALKIIQ